ncbi:MAG: hypothetical protein PHV53_08010 [Fermentimonas sp.]|nr:hypothetical protein [Fermentimonas sp.]
MFYNVENLFDTSDNPVKDDNDFLPDGFMNWTPWKYRKKLRNITSVITAVGGMHSPALAGLCEVENDSVMHDLINHSPLWAQGYDYVITDSPDIRGINIALLYQRHQFKLLGSTEYEIKLKEKNRRPTRNILHATGLIINSDTLDVFVCHFPSRSGGEKETEQARIESALVLRERVDSLLSKRDIANIIIMGDFNDQPDDKSMSESLQASSIDILSEYKLSEIDYDKELFNLFRSSDIEKDRDKGTYKYQGKWYINDHIIVSGNLLNPKSPVNVKNNEVNIYNGDFLLEDDKKYYGKKPFRTNLGPRYNNGFSDHLPIYTDLIINPHSAI